MTLTWACEDCGRAWPVPGAPPLGSECDSCGGPLVCDDVDQAAFDRDEEMFGPQDHDLEPGYDDELDAAEAEAEVDRAIAALRAKLASPAPAWRPFAPERVLPYWRCQAVKPTGAVMLYSVTAPDLGAATEAALHFLPSGADLKVWAETPKGGEHDVG